MVSWVLAKVAPTSVMIWMENSPMDRASQVELTDFALALSKYTVMRTTTMTVGVIFEIY